VDVRDTDWGESFKASKIIIKFRNGNNLETICGNNNFGYFSDPIIIPPITHILY